MGVTVHPSGGVDLAQREASGLLGEQLGEVVVEGGGRRGDGEHESACVRGRLLLECMEGRTDLLAEHLGDQTSDLVERQAL